MPAPERLYNSFRLKQLLFISLCLVFISSFSQNGPPWLWTKQAHSINAEWITGVAADPSGNVVACGIYNGGLTGYGVNVAGSVGGGLVAKYDAAGNVTWAFPIGNNQDDACNGICTDAAGNIYITGYVGQLADMRGNSLVPYNIFSNGSKDLYVAKYDPNGNILWAVAAGGTGDDEGAAVCVNNNRVYITGYYEGSVNFGNGVNTPALGGTNDRAFTACFDMNGNIQWVAEASSSNVAYGKSISADNSNVFVSGMSKGASLKIYDGVTGSGGTAAITLSGGNASSYDGYAYSLNASTGAYVWAKQVYSNGDDYANAITQSGNFVYLAGAASNNASITSYATPVTGGGTAGLDTYIAQLSKSSGVPQWVKSEAGTSDEIITGISIDTLNLISVCGSYKSALTFAGGGTITSTGNEDVFVAAYNLSGVFQWADKGGANGVDIPHGISSNSSGFIFTGGEYTNNAIFGKDTLTQDSPPNIFVSKIGCSPIINNIVAASQTICPTTTAAVLTGSVVSGSSGTYSYQWQQSPNGTAWTNAVNTSTNTTYAPGSLSSTTYYRRIVAATNGCFNTSTSNTISITVMNSIAAPNAGSDQTVCATSAVMNGTVPSIGTGTWSVYSGSGTFANPNSATTTVNGLAAGTNGFIWTVGNGICPTKKDTVYIKRDLSPTASNAGSNQHICGNSVTLNGNTPAVGTASWTVVSGSGIIASATLATTSVSNLGTGNNAFMWTIKNGICPASTATVSILADANPAAANAGSSQHICGSTTSLAANVPSVGTGSWSVVSGSGFISSPSSANTSVNGLSTGSNILQWTITNGICPASTATINILADANPTNANAGASQTICKTTYTLNANAPLVGTGQWSDISGPGIIAPSNSNSAIASNLATGSNVLVWTISNGTVCPASSSTVVITVNAAPSAAQAGADQLICTNSTTLSAVAPSIGSGSWSAISAGAMVNPAGSPTTTASNLITGQNIFVWTVINGVCEPKRDTLIVTTNLNPSPANAGNDVSVCGQSVLLNASPPAIGNGHWQLVSGAGALSNSTAANSQVTGLSYGNNIFAWINANGFCPSSSDTMIVTAYQNPSTSYAGKDTIIYTDALSLYAVAASAGTGSWSVVSGGGSFADTHDAHSEISNLPTGTNVLKWTVSNGVCADSSDEMVIIVKPLKIPNGFSPNGDGTNDDFVIEGLDEMGTTSLQIFNRWGNLVYESSSYKNDWNGKNMSGEELSDDTYYYTMEIAKQKHKGFVLLKRK